MAGIQQVLITLLISLQNLSKVLFLSSPHHHLARGPFARVYHISCCYPTLHTCQSKGETVSPPLSKFLSNFKQNIEREQERFSHKTVVTDQGSEQSMVTFKDINQYKKKDLKHIFKKFRGIL